MVCALAILCLATSCAANDDQFDVKVTNGTPNTVVLGACNDLCGSFADTWTLRPNMAASIAQDPDGVFRPVEVLSESHELLGCLPFRFSTTPSTDVAVDITQMVPCGSTVGAAAVGRKDWPKV